MRPVVYQDPAEVVADIPDGASIFIGGFGPLGYPFTLLEELYKGVCESDPRIMPDRFAQPQGGGTERFTSVTGNADAGARRSSNDRVQSTVPRTAGPRRRR